MLNLVPGAYVRDLVHLVILSNALGKFSIQRLSGWSEPSQCLKPFATYLLSQTCLSSRFLSIHSILSILFFLSIHLPSTAVTPFPSQEGEKTAVPTSASDTLSSGRGKLYHPLTKVRASVRVEFWELKSTHIKLRRLRHTALGFEITVTSSFLLLLNKPRRPNSPSTLSHKRANHCLVLMCEPIFNTLKLNSGYNWI